ncbi:hypothetical protein AQUCO_00100039v1 [Aquilegia coerulea]|uniref:Uncharacterized protein n=1 Tax=Aquilegia coerulea TaxID=218851 RepID=A0A2G5F8F2_AQUCA|nr:hypothetical protein AQUCO_00100039v1 [Aquilegia coerulea]
MDYEQIHNSNHFHIYLLVLKMSTPWSMDCTHTRLLPLAQVLILFSYSQKNDLPQNYCDKGGAHCKRQ